ncbi:MAG: dihydroorotase [Bacteroidetes bacterium]|nr:dihydroorotase [Bacteroidota bacterium]
MEKAKYLILNANIVNEGIIKTANVFIENGIISNIDFNNTFDTNKDLYTDFITIDAKGKYLLPGIIDDQVHFREPGLTSKGDIYSESKAAVAGGVTSFMDMPNTNPQTLSQELLEEKYQIAAQKSLANYSFYMGVSNDNLEEILKTNPENVCGIKLFMGASTGNMLVDNPETLENIFSKSKMLIALHCEDEKTIQQNIAIYKQKYGDDVPMYEHPAIRSEEACFLSSSYAVRLAKKHNTRIHILHLSTAKECELFDNSIPLSKKRITAEVCVHHLWFSDKDYSEKGSYIKWNPSIKTENDRDTLINAVLSDKIDIIATDHAPHTSEEKQNSYFKAPSGGPLVQHSLVAMLDLYHQGKIKLEKIVEKMCHNPAILFGVEKRGFIRENYAADLVLVDLDNNWTVEKSNILYKCSWSPFENHTFKSKVTHTFVNGNLVYDNGVFNEINKGERLLFNR